MPEYVSVTKNIIVVNKPFGLPTTYKNSKDNSDCLVKQVTQDYPDILEVNGFQEREGGLLYRLDNDTSGITVIAKNQKTFDFLKQEQDQNRLLKTYYAICEGKINQRSLTVKQFYPKPVEEYSFTKYPDEFFKIFNINTTQNKDNIDYFLINFPIGHSKKNTKKMIAIKGKNYKCRGTAREAKTYVRVLQQKDDIFLIEAIISKGSRHQVRIHLSSIGLKIIGDSLYNSQSKIQLTPKRLYLHCGKVFINQIGP